MSEIQLTDEQKEEILRRGRDADTFLHSPLFVALSQWKDTEEKNLGKLIALDIRSKGQERLTREQFIEQMTGYYRGIMAVLAKLQEYVSVGNDLDKRLGEESALRAEQAKEETVVSQLKEKAYGSK